MSCHVLGLTYLSRGLIGVGYLQHLKYALLPPYIYYYLYSLVAMLAFAYALCSLPTITYGFLLRNYTVSTP